MLQLLIWNDLRAEGELALAALVLVVLLGFRSAVLEPTNRLLRVKVFASVAMSHFGTMALIVNSLRTKGAILDFPLNELLLFCLNLGGVHLWHEEDVNLPHLLAAEELSALLECELGRFVAYLRFLLDTFRRIVGIK